VVMTDDDDSGDDDDVSSDDNGYLLDVLAYLVKLTSI